jgi:hypothetical protein
MAELYKNPNDKAFDWIGGIISRQLGRNGKGYHPLPFLPSRSLSERADEL